MLDVAVAEGVGRGAVGAMVAVFGGIISSGGGAGFVAMGVAVTGAVVGGTPVSVGIGSGVAVGVALPGRLQALRERESSAMMRSVRGHGCIGKAPGSYTPAWAARSSHVQVGV